MATLKEMLSMKERMFKTMFDSVLTAVNMRIGVVVRSVADLKASLQFSQKDMDKESADRLVEIKDELDGIQRSLNKHGDKIEYLENHSRRNNIRIDGISEDLNES